jgi:hypothetical protein
MQRIIALGSSGSNAGADFNADRRVIHELTHPGTLGHGY